MRFLGSWSALGWSGPATVAGFGAGFLLTQVLWLLLRPGAPVSQPIAFNHAKHIAAGLTCTNCHSGAQAEARAALPGIQVCLSCHEAAVTDSAEEAKIRRAAAAGEDLRWTKVTRVPAHVYFSHRRHVQAAQLSCAQCHGPVEKATVPPGRPFRVMTMDACLGCHQQKQVQTDCNDCHR